MSDRAASGPDLLDEIRAFGRSSGTPCTTSLFLATLTAEKTAAISAARAEGIASAVIGRWLQSLGYRGTSDSVSRHLVGRCQCPKT